MMLLQLVSKAIMSVPSDKDKRLVTRIRSRVFDILKPGEDRSDQFLIRWIRAANGSLEKAELNIRKSFEWRRENNVDSILEEPWDTSMIQDYPFWVRSLDSLGHPVIEVPLGRWDLAKAIEEDKEEMVIRHVIQLSELLMQKIRDSNFGRQPWEFQNTQMTAITDWEGFTFTQFVNWKALQCMLRIMSLFDTHYPETVFKAFFINCPSMFPKFYAMMKPLISENTIRRIKLYGTRRDEWEPKLKALINIDQLAENYGGTLPRKY